MYINPIFRPFDPHFHHFSFGEWERILGVRAQPVCVRKRGASINFGKLFIPRPIFQVKKLFPSSKTQLFTHFTIFYLNSKHISLNLKLFLRLTSHETDQPTLDYICIFIQNSWKWFHFRLKYVSSWFKMQNLTCALMFQIWYFLSKFQFYTWNSLFGMHAKLISFIFKSSHIFIKLGDHVQNISKFSFEILDCFKHFWLSIYLHDSSPTPTTNGWWGFKRW